MNPGALKAFQEKQKEFLVEMKKLESNMKKSLKVDKDKIDYGHVGSLNYVVEKIKETNEFLGD